MTAALIIFILTYIGIAAGHIPGLVIDRTGIALLGAILMVTTGVITREQAVESIDMPTILLLFALMIISAQLRLSGAYSRLALQVVSLLHRPRLALAVLMIVSAVLSAILANDIICLAFTPVLCISVLRVGLNPIPYLIGLAVASNIGSAATIIGNPQNMLIGQIGNLDFLKFMLYNMIPSLLSLAGSFFIIEKIHRNDINKPAVTTFRENRYWPDYAPQQSLKGMIGVSVLVSLFFTEIPREISALVIAGTLLCSRKMRTRSILGLVDWHLITLFCSLFIVIEGIKSCHVPETFMSWSALWGMEVSNPYILSIFSVTLSNLVSNVPAVMLLIQFLPPDGTYLWYILAMTSTFAGNLFIIGSIANLITFEQAREFGIEVGFRQHARAGIPVTLLSILVAFGWIYGVEWIRVIF